MNRREFTLTGAAALAASALPGWAKSRAQRIRVGTQTNTFGVPIKPLEHLLEVLDTIAKLNYAAFETNYVALEPYADRAAECRRDFESRKVQFLAPHTDLRMWDRSKHDEEIEKLRGIGAWSAQMGATHLIASGRKLPHPDGKLDQDAAHAKAEGMNKLGAALQKEGLKFCYHNHVPEFADEPSEMSILLKETDPKTVWLNYDIGNAYPVGPDPAQFSAENFRRIAIYHIKDVTMNPGATKNEAVDLGAGKLNLKGVVAPLLNSDWEGWLVVEREEHYPKGAEHPEVLLRQCRDYIRTIAGV